MKFSRSAWAAIVLLLVAVVSFWRAGGSYPGGDGVDDPVAEAADARAGPLRTSERDPARAHQRREAIAAAAARWHEELWEKYPRLRPDYRDVPDERNGYLQFLLFLEGLDGPVLPESLREMLAGAESWNPAAYRAWLAENQGIVDELLRIAALPDRSTKGFDLDRVMNAPPAESTSFGLVLTGAARLAMDDGDPEAALRFAKASLAICEHLTGIEAPTMLGRVIAAGAESRVRELFGQDVLPLISADPGMLREWRDALTPSETPAEIYSRVMIGEWNWTTRAILLPALLGDRSAIGDELQLPHPDAIISLHAKIALQASDGIFADGPQRFSIHGGTLQIPGNDIDPASLEILEHFGLAMRGMTEALGRQATMISLNSAAISLLLGEIAPEDPVSSQPFIWDPETRILSAPGAQGPEDGIRVP